MKMFITILLFFGSFGIVAQQIQSEELRVSNWVDGTLVLPSVKESIPLAIIIQGSGPTDRNGNQPMMNNNSLKMLAEGLADEGVASFRYDKRLIKMVQDPNFSEENVSFNDFIKDAKDVITYFEMDPRFDKIVVIGHSQGSLVGMLAAQDTTVDGLVSIAGAGQEIDDVIVDQIARQAPFLKDSARKSFDDLRVNGVVTDYDQNLASIFRLSIQPFMMTWMEYNPQEEIKKLNIPVLILNGDVDLQVNVEEARLLNKAKPESQLVIVSQMNHVLKEIDTTDQLDNGKSYNDPNRPLEKSVVPVIANFIKQEN